MDDCEKCGGKCCSAYRVEVIGGLDDIDWEMIYMYGQTYWMRKKEDKMTCVAFEDGKCSIYDRRPTVCRQFEVGEPRCLKLRKL